MVAPGLIKKACPPEHTSAEIIVRKRSKCGRSMMSIKI